MFKAALSESKCELSNDGQYEPRVLIYSIDFHLSF